MTSVIYLRPVHHGLEARIRAHVSLCWLARLLIRIIETTTGASWTTTEVAVSALVGDLIDPDPARPSEPVVHRFDVAPDPGDLVVEDPGVAGAVPSPRAALRRGAWFSLTARMIPAVTKAIASIAEDTWTTISSPNAIWDEAEQGWALRRRARRGRVHRITNSTLGLVEANERHRDRAIRRPDRRAVIPAPCFGAVRQRAQSGLLVLWPSVSGRRGS